MKHQIISNYKPVNPDLQDLLRPFIESASEYQEWISWMQSELISRGLCQELTRLGSEQFADRFFNLQTFFTGLAKLKKS